MTPADERRQPDAHRPGAPSGADPASRAATRVPELRGSTGLGAESGADTPLRVRDPGELVAILPALIGFHPRESLVLIATGGPSGRRIGLTVRVDLPPPEHVEAVVADAVRGLLLDHPHAAAVVVLSERTAGGGPPSVELAAAAVDGLERQGVSVHAAVWATSTTAGARWACYDPCGCSGVLPDPACTAFAAAVVAGGQVIHRDRAELERLVAPECPDRIRRRERLLVARLDRAAHRADLGAACAASATAVPVGSAVVDAAVTAAAEGRLDLTDEKVVDLACALGDLAVRDAALQHNVGPHAAAAEQLWTALVRTMPEPDVVEPAALLVVSALLRGDGGLANVALDRAERAWPGHRLTRLLRTAAGAGMRPEQVRAWLLGSTPEPATRSAAGEGRSTGSVPPHSR
jgi:hypothetical protein